MSDRPRNPSRAGLFSGEAPFDRSAGETADPRQGPPFSPRHSASPPAIESPTESIERTRTVNDNEAEQLARTLKDLFQSLPRRPGVTSESAPASAPGGVAGVAAPTFEDFPSDERRAKFGEDSPGLGTESASTGPGGGDSPAMGGHGEDSFARPDLCQGGDTATVALVTPISAVPDGETTGTPPADGNEADAGGTSGGLATPSPSPFAAESTMIGADAGAIAAGVGPAADLGRLGSPSAGATIEATAQGGTPAAWSSPETVAIGSIGLVGHNAEGFDPTLSSSTSAMTWGGVSGGVPFATANGTVSPGGEGPSGLDLGPTNALLGQILDELRRHQQSAPIVSGRSVYPER